jgi:hypothetical protein
MRHFRYKNATPAEETQRVFGEYFLKNARSDLYLSQNTRPSARIQVFAPPNFAKGYDFSPAHGTRITQSQQQTA